MGEKKLKALVAELANGLKIELISISSPQTDEAYS